MTTRSRYTAAITDKPWWLAGGIPPGACVAAYQAKGASSLAASYVNLANPGTYTITEVISSPVWTSTGGWTSDGSVLLNSNVPENNQYSMIAKVYNGAPGGSDRYILYAYNPARRYMGIQHYRDGKFKVVNQASVEVTGINATEGVIALCSGYTTFSGYYNGVYQNVTNIGSATDAGTYHIFGRVGGAALFIGTIVSCAIYAFNIERYVISLTDAMNAL